METNAVKMLQEDTKMLTLFSAKATRCHLCDAIKECESKIRSYFKFTLI